MTEPPLTEAQIDAARRLGRVAGLIAKAQTNPETLGPVPRWIVTCLSHIGEASAKGGAEAVAAIESATPLAVGYSMGNIGTMISLIRSPQEGVGKSLNAWVNEYFTTYFKEINLQIPGPVDFWQLFTKEVLGVFFTSNYEQRLQFLEGARRSTESELVFRSGEIRETTATRIYAELLLFYPEIMRMGSLAEVYRFLQTRFTESPAQLGDFERFRKLANRIELSFKEI